MDNTSLYSYDEPDSSEKNDCSSAEVLTNTDTNRPGTKIFNNREKILFKSLNNFYRRGVSSEYIERMINIIERKSQISLRIFDWLVTQYSKRHTTIQLMKGGRAIEFNLKVDYKAQLKSYRKKYFDPFRRNEKERFIFFYSQHDDKLSVVTTLGQLNFFKWLIENNIIDFVEEHKDELIKEMTNTNKVDDKKNKKSVRKKEVPQINFDSISI